MANIFSVSAALDKLKTEIDQRRQKELYQAVTDAIEKISQSKGPQERTQLQQSNNEVHMLLIKQESSAIQEEILGEADAYWLPFRLACNPNNPPKLREIALDLIQKLIASGSLRGSSKSTFSAEPVQESPKEAGKDHPKEQQTSSYPSLLIDDIIHIVCSATPLSSFNDPQSNSPESAVHLQIIKVLLTVITSPLVEVHETSLLKGMQACVNVFLYSKNLVNQTTAKAGLTQMCHHVFSRMEKFAEEMEKRHGSNSNGNHVEIPIDDPSSSTSAEPKSPPSNESASDSSVKLRTEKILQTNIQQYPNMNQVEQSDKNNPYTCDDENYFQLMRRDTFLVFRFFCRLSVRVDKPRKDTEKEVVDDLSQITLRLRALALEMILLILTNSGRILQTEEPYLSIVRHNVTVALLKNGLLMQPQLFELALSNFLLLLKVYKAILKAEVEVLFNEVYLYVLDNQNSTLKQKLMVLQGLFKVCNNPQVLVDLYVNYDCDLNMASIYERIVTILSRICQGSGMKVNLGRDKSVGVFGIDPDANNDQTILAERKLRSKALRCLVAITSSLVEWMKENPNQPGISIVSATVDMLAGSSKSPTMKAEGASSTSSADSKSPPTSAAPLPTLVYKNPLHTVSMSDSRSSSSQIIDSEASTQMSNPEEYERVKNKKVLLKQGIARFNESPNKGIAFLKENGFLSTPLSVAKFLRENSELSKVAIGDFIGDVKELNMNVMHAFIDSFDFSRTDFVSAIRKFLQSFRLPGEAQKIDRIMEKFAARFCENNPQVFAKADTAYVLAFSIMMLNTDLHSSSIKQRMTKEGFLKNNRGINDNQDLPDEFLSQIYDEIQNNEIILEEERTVKELEKMTKVTTKRELYKRETKHVEKKSQSLMKKGKEKGMMKYRSATHVDHARPMFEVLSWPLIAVLSLSFEECLADDYPVTDDSRQMFDLPPGDSNVQIIDLALIGFYHAIKISCIFRMETERDAFVSSLGKLTCLSDLNELKAKNLAAVKGLLSVGQQFGNLLEDSWRYLLKCLSDMDKWQLLGDSKSGQIVSDNGVVVDLRALHQRRPSLSKISDAFSSQAMIITIDKIFESSVTLDGSSIIHFYQSACLVSEEEIELGRIFMLQKIVEISYYNMSRIRLEWSQIWKILTGFFNMVGCHENISVATYAVDSLRQLGMKFLDRAELSHFHTNNEFMKPFEHIIRQTKFPAIKELVIQSIEQMVIARARNIRSGWKSIFVILSRVSVNGDLLNQVRQCLELLRNVQEKYFEMFSKDFFVDYVNCLIEFLVASDKVLNKQTSEDASFVMEESINLLLLSTDRLSVEQEQKKPGKIEDDAFYLQWFPVLSGLSRLQRDCKYSLVRSKALDAFFELLKKNGHKFSFERNHWRTIVKSVLMPIFEDLKLGDRAGGDSPDLQNHAIWVQAIRRMIETYTTFFKESDKEGFIHSQDLVKDLLDLMILLCGKNSDNLSHTGIIYLNQFIRHNFTKFDEPTWFLAIEAIESVFRATLPVELLKFPISQKQRVMTDIDAANEQRLIQSIDVQHAVLKCAVHLFALQFVRDICLKPEDDALHLLSGQQAATLASPASSVSSLGNPLLHLPSIAELPSQFLLEMPADCRRRLLSCLHASFVFANSFNGNYDLRLSLWKAGAVQQMPNLIKQETQSIGILLSLLFHLYRAFGDTSSDTGESDPGINILENSSLVYRRDHPPLQSLLLESRRILERFAEFLSDPGKFNRDIVSWAVIIRLIWKELLAVDWGKPKPANHEEKYTELKKQIPAFFRLAIKIISVDRQDVRSVLQEFLERVAYAVDSEGFIKSL